MAHIYVPTQGHPTFPPEFDINIQFVFVMVPNTVLSVSFLILRKLKRSYWHATCKETTADTNSPATVLLCPFIRQHFIHAPATNSEVLRVQSKDWWERVVLINFFVCRQIVDHCRVCILSQNAAKVLHGGNSVIKVCILPVEISSICWLGMFWSMAVGLSWFKLVLNRS